MAQCSKCNRPYSCSCKLVNGKCTICITKEQEEARMQQQLKNQNTKK